MMQRTTLLPLTAAAVLIAAPAFADPAKGADAAGPVGGVAVPPTTTAVDAPLVPAAAPVDLDKIEKEMKQLRAKFFRATRNSQVRAIGLGKMRAYTDPALFPLLVKTFATEDADVRSALVEHLAAQRSIEADTVLARVGVFAEDRAMRELAAAKLTERYESGRVVVPYVVQQPMADGLRTRSQAPTVAAAQLCNLLNLIDAIPMLISAQAVSGVGTGAGGPVNGDAQPAIAALVVGQQESFVSGLTPIVGNSAVGFNPQVSVLNTGTVLRIIDANVVTYRTEVTVALGALASRNWGGQSVTHLGSNPEAWAHWYREEFAPYRAALAAKAAPGGAASSKP